MRYCTLRSDIINKWITANTTYPSRSSMKHERIFAASAIFVDPPSKSPGFLSSFMLVNFFFGSCRVFFFSLSFDLAWSACFSWLFARIATALHTSAAADFKWNATRGDVRFACSDGKWQRITSVDLSVRMMRYDTLCTRYHIAIAGVVVARRSAFYTHMTNHTNLPSTNERNDSALQFVLILYGTMAAKFDKCHDGIGRTGTYRMLAFTISTCRCKYNGTRCFYSPWWTLLAMVVVLSIAAFANFARNQITIAFNNQCQAANNNIAPKQHWSADIVCIIENRQKSACHLKRCHHIKLTNNNEENTAIKLVTTKKVYLTPSTISHVIRQMSDYVKSLL